MTRSYSTHVPSPDPPRADALIIFRQSSAQATEDLFTLIERTLYLYPDLPGWEQIYGRGTDPLERPEPTDHFETLPSQGRACLYQTEGTWVLLILGSAAAPNERGVEHEGHENAVVNLITSVVRRLRPRTVLIGPFDRISRSQHFAGKTYAAFDTAGVEVLRYEGAEGVEEIRFGGNDADDKFFDLARTAHAQLKTIVTRTTRGKASLCRRNKWFLGAESTPFGLTTDSGKRLVAVDADRASLAVIVDGYANDETDADIARRLVAACPVRRRRGEDDRTLRDGDLGAASAAKTQARHEKIVRTFRNQMLDLAMGKFVLPQDEPLSTRMQHVGVRREPGIKGRFVYFFAWDVPDIFEGFDDCQLDAALLNVARRQYRAGRRPSLWLEECQQRLDAVRKFQAEPETVEAKEIARWLHGDLALKRVVAAGPEHPRAARVRQIVAQVLAEPVTGNPNTSTPSRLRLFSGYPAWRQGDDEWKIKTTPETYTFLRRPADSSTSHESSLLRPWGIAGGRFPRDLVVAQVPHEVFTACVADAAAAAVNDGVEVLRGQHAASLGIVDAVASMQTAKTLRRQALLDVIDDVRSEVEVWRDRQHSLSRARQQGERVAGGASTSDSLFERELDAAVENEFKALGRLAALEAQVAELDRVQQVTAPDALPDLDDLDLVLQTLVAMRTCRGGDRRDVEAVRNLIHAIRYVEGDVFTATFEFRLRLPAPGRSWLGTQPIRVTVPLGGRNPVGYDNWSHAYCEELCTRQLTVDHCRSTRVGNTLVDPEFTPGHRAWESAIKFLMQRGLKRGPAKHILGTVNLLPRTVAYHLVTGAPLDCAALGITTDYTELIRKTYLSPHPELPVKRPDHAARREFQRLLNTIAASHLPYYRSEDLADFRNLPKEGDPKARDKTAATWVMLRRENIDGLLSKRKVLGVSRDGKKRDRPAFFLRTCPHCDAAGEPHPLDIVVWNPEVPGGLLCSQCLRTDRSDSIVYPETYRDLLYADKRQHPTRPALLTTNDDSGTCQPSENDAA